MCSLMSPTNRCGCCSQRWSTMRVWNTSTLETTASQTRAWPTSPISYRHFFLCKLFFVIADEGVTYIADLLQAWQNVFSSYRMCSLPIECVLLQWWWPASPSSYRQKASGRWQYYVTSSYILFHIIIHTMSHHHTYYVTSSYILYLSTIRDFPDAESC